MKKRIALILTALLLSSLLLSQAGCGLSALQGEEQASALADPQQELAAHVAQLRENRVMFERMVHDLINEERDKEGLPALDWEEALVPVARYHSEDMATRQYFNHVSPEGETFSDRYDKFGYTCSRKVGTTIYMGGENLLQNSVYDYYSYNEETGAVLEYHLVGMEQLARDTVQGWMDSPDHRKNVLFPHFQNEAIGIYITDDGKVYYTQNFC